MIEDLLPHRAPMLLIDGVEGVTAQGGTGRARLEPTAWHAGPDGRTPAWFGLELMAQTIAACRGQHLKATGAVARGGYLVGTRSYRSTLEAFPVGADLEIRADLQDDDPSGLCVFRCAILEAGVILAEATLNVMERR